MSQRLLAGLLALAAVVCAQHRSDPRNTYSRIIAVVPYVGKGTYTDPRRPEYAPWPLTGQSQANIIGYSHVSSDDGQYAIVEFIARDRSAFQAVFNDKTVTYFEKGKDQASVIEAAIQKYRKDYTLAKYGMVMP
jgi:hypothetical protein